MLPALIGDVIYEPSDYLFHVICKPSDYYFRCPLPLKPFPESAAGRGLLARRRSGTIGQGPG
jgi:hypothetical protein